MPYEWGRLALLVAVTAAVVAGGELLLPTEGFGGFIARTAVWLALPALLFATGFLSATERAALRTMLNPTAVRQRLRELRAAPSPQDAPEADRPGRVGPEVYEAVRGDEDRL